MELSCSQVIICLDIWLSTVTNKPNKKKIVMLTPLQRLHVCAKFDKHLQGFL